MAVLTHKRLDGTEKVLDAGDRPLVVGRLDDSDIAVRDPFVSRVHCGVLYHSGQFHLKDLGSSNGTYCNGARVFDCPLTAGDRIQVGNTTLLLELNRDGSGLLRQLTPTPGTHRAAITVTSPMQSLNKPVPNP